MRFHIFLMAAPPARRHVPAGVDDDEIGFAEVFAEPFG
jgi:hypothetical protein